MTNYLKQQKRYVSILLALLLVVLFTVSGFVWNDKTVTIVADGKTQVVKTHLNSASGVVRDAGINLGKNDAVIVSTPYIQEGSTLTVLRAIPVTVTVDGKTKNVMTVQRSVQSLADELGYTSPNYMPVENGDSALTSGSKVEIARITSTQMAHRDEVVPVEVVRERDDTLAKGEEKVAQQGSEGIRTIEEETFYSNGKVIKKQVVKETNTKAMVPTIIKEGTREVETSRGTSRYRQVLTMEATAYLPTDGGGHGITASGMVARRGVVAVDPNVIPLGTRLYIPGYGEAVAGDTGGAIQGHRIDLVMESYSEAMNFGRRSVEVYVL